ncbi:unnamed protein product [Cylicostephanus goldi]|uniref:DUF4440 domain-containing protein n=1 Tax=Cylicostephanus goldi TaxID=71465 RepID=A0A3P7MDL2_CYLGO|nr:unnamed protein product [Cylicostephanus goldi]
MSSSEEAKSILAPVLGQFHELAKAKDFKKLAAFYDPDAVFVHAGKDIIYGREELSALILALVKSFEDFLASAGKLTRKSSDEQYSMCEDFIILTANYETETEKLGVLKGKFTQIWRKNNNTYMLLHFEDALT